jgi:hypothetical protein
LIASKKRVQVTATNEDGDKGDKADEDFADHSFDFVRRGGAFKSAPAESICRRRHRRVTNLWQNRRNTSCDPASDAGYFAKDAHQAGRIGPKEH